MEEYILKCLNNIELSENNILNGSIFTCKVNSDSYPCQNCLSCKLIVLRSFSISLLNHMTDNEIIKFIKNCSKNNTQTELVNILEQTLYPLNGKDRLYSLSRTVPSLNTDLTDFSIKNITIDKAQLENVTQQISSWISNQPDVFQIQFIVSLLSHLKLAVLSEIYCSICRNGISNNLSNSSNETFISSVNNSILSSDNLLNEIEVNYNKKNLSDNQINKYFKIVNDNTFQIDFISNLPVHISKKIINMLDEKSLTVCSDVCENWKKIVNQVRKEDIASIQMKEQAIMLQNQKDGLKSVSSTPADPRFARDTDITVPQLDPFTHKIMYTENKKPSEEFHDNYNQNDLKNDTQTLISRQIYSMDVAYKNIVTKNIIIEERNVFCGSYSVLMIFESASKSKYIMRTISFNGGQLVAVAGANKIIQFIDKKRNQSELMKNRIRGHTGSIKVIRLISKPNTIFSRKKFSANSDNNNSISHKDLEVLSGSYDTTIRRWDSITGKCLKIYNGHSATISDLDTGEEIFASGSFDGTCKLWRYQDKHSFATMRHKHPVTAVAISNKLCVSGDSTGLIKVWNIQNGDHIKNLSGHFKEISALRLDDFHIVSASHDSFVMLWSTVGDFNSCIGNFRHPKPVLCMEFMYLRAITGCEDGKIRIWNVLNGQTIRIIRGNSKSDPILNLIAHEDTIIINTVSNILVLNFEPIDWIYNFDKNNTSYNNLFLLNNSENEQSEKKITNFQHINQRCMRSRFAGNIDPRIFVTPIIEGLNINSKVQQNSEFINTRSFSNGIPLTRSTAWIVSPTLCKSNNTNKKPPLPKFDVMDNTNFDEEFKITEFAKEPERSHTESQSIRRVSYGFERQDHLMCNVDLKEVKQTLRQHIRSPPNISAEAMPEFIKTMVSQLKTAGLTGRPISSVSFNRYNRPSSGPSKVDSKSKIGVEEIKNLISPVTNQSTNFSDDLINFESLSKHQPDPSLKEKNSSKVLVHSNIKSSSVVFINQPVIGPFFVPPDYRKKLAEKKSEFDQRHQTNSNHHHQHHQSVNNLTENSKKLKYKLLINKLNLQTFENSQHELEKIEQQRLRYETEQKEKAATDYHLKWLKRATEPPVLKYEKDAIMKRPRSAKI